MRVSGAALFVVMMAGLSCSGPVCGQLTTVPPREKAPAAPDNAVNPPADEAAAAAAKERVPAELTLLDAGQEPRTALRYKPKVGQKQSFNLFIHPTAGSQSMGANRRAADPSPRIQFAIQTEVKSINDAGDIHYVFGITEGTALDGRGVNPLTLSGKRELCSMLVGVTGMATISNRGFTQEAGIVIPPTVNRVKQHVAIMLQSVRNALEQNWLLLPDEAVGVGAKWQVVSYSDANPNFARIKQVATYELTSMANGRARVSVHVVESAGRQLLPTQSLPGTTQSLVSHESEGKGSMTLDFSKLMPMLSTVTLDTATELELDMNGHVEHFMATFTIENQVETVLE